MRATFSLAMAIGASVNVAGLAVSTEAQAKSPAGDIQSSADTAQPAGLGNQGQVAAPNNDEATIGNEVIVTARKREESLISVPVVMTAIGSAELVRRGVTGLDAISQIVPQLIIGNNTGSIQGGTISLRGISGPAGNPQGDQAVAFNIDGVQVAKASVRRIGLFDLERIEVLKGPQALFYGKNSPGGIITVKTADPTQDLSASVSTAYEFNAHEYRVEGYVSAPVSDTLGVRLAGFVGHSRGYLNVTTPDTAYLAPNFSWSPQGRNFGLRGTVKFTPNDRLFVRAKLAYGRFKDNGGAASSQTVFCATGAPQVGGGDCKPNGKTIVTSLGPVVGTLDPVFGNGESISRQLQTLGSLEIGYDLTDNVNITSVTGYYSTSFRNTANYGGVNFAVLGGQRYRDKEYSQELRLDTTYEGPFNITGGLYYSHSRQANSTIALVLAAEQAASNIPIAAALINRGLLRVPVQLSNSLMNTKGSSYSAFLQARIKPVEGVEISAGGRYSHEAKSILNILSSGNRLGAALAGGAAFVARDPNNPNHVIDPSVRKKTWNDFSPEVTISYMPDQDLNIFASYKHGFLSGGFNASNVAFVDGVDVSYNPETIEGFEAGFKANLLDRKMQANFAVYSYKLNGLQTATFINGQSRLQNAAGVRVKGAEFDFRYRTPFSGLILRGSAAYNKGRYTSFANAPCYAGQTSAEGCNLANQDLSGSELSAAPKWNLSSGFDYDTPVGDRLVFGLSAGATYSSSFLTDVTSNPDGRMPSYTLFDASIRLGASDDRWRLDLIGRNLTNKYYWNASTNTSFTGGAAGSGMHGDVIASVGRGREIWIKATLNFK